MPLLLIGIVLQWIFYPFQFFADGAGRFDFISTLVSTGKIVPMKYSLIGPIFSYPFALIDQIRGNHYWLLHYNYILMCLAVFILFSLLKRLVSHRFLIIFIAFLFFGSMFPGHAIHYYGEVFSALCMMLGIVLIEKKNTIPGWILMTLSVGNIPATIIPLVFICVYKIIKEKKVEYLLLPVFAVMAMLVDSKLRMPRTTQGFTNYLLDDRGFHTILPYSGAPGFSYPMALGLLGELFSYGKGLLFFAPGLLLSYTVWKQLKEKVIKNIYVLWWIYLVGLILVYSKWWAWYGGWFWGPRFLLFASIPASFNFAHLLTNSSTTAKVKMFALLVALWSFWVGVNGVIFGQAGLDICTINNYALEHLCWYVPEFSALFHPIVARLPVTIFGWVMMIYTLCLWLYIAGITFIGTKKKP